MKKGIGKLVVIYLIFMVFFALQRILFLAVYHHTVHASVAQCAQALLHGMAMDASVAGYLSLVPALLIIVSIWIPRRGVRIAEKVWFAICAVSMALVTVLDLILYGYWRFRLDMTPFFYFSTSPEAAMASAEWWQLPAGVTEVALMAWGVYAALVHGVKRLAPPYSPRKATTAAMILLTALMFIPIRGGVTVSTMNLSRAYFSDNTALNHAAINPLFSLIYSSQQQHNFGEVYRFTDEAEALLLFRSLEEPEASAVPKDTITLATERPDIYLIILESFSSHLLPSLGGEEIATGLDSIAAQGILFTDIYASSFRTDRALPAILSAFPGQPSMSIMKHVGKMETLPSISATLAAVGYRTSYYYGGDINFTNMNSYLVHSGFRHIVCDKDFPINQRLGKWGAPDHLVFAKALADRNHERKQGTPQFTVIQTSSSHEPYDVPYSSPRFSHNKKLNAFAYTDRSLSTFADSLKHLPGYANTLIIIIPDHYGVYPENLTSPLDRHRVPLIMTGGALQGTPARVNTIGSQTDIAATLLTLLGLDAKAFEFSHDLLQPGRRGYAFFSEPSLIGMVTPTDTALYNPDAQKSMAHTGTESSIRRLRAYLQHLYTRIAEMH